MFDSVFKAFESFVVEFTVRRLAGAVLLLAVGVVGFYCLDRYSPYFTIGRLERATGIMERLAVVDSQADGDLSELRRAIIRQLEAQVEPEPLIALLAVGSTATRAIWKFASGIGLWLLFALFYLPNVRTDASNWNGVFGAVFVGVFFGFLGTVFIPDDWVTWKVLVVYCVGNFLISVLVILAWQARQALRAKRLASRPLQPTRGVTP